MSFRVTLPSPFEKEEILAVIMFLARHFGIQAKGEDDMPTHIALTDRRQVEGPGHLGWSPASNSEGGESRRESARGGGGTSGRRAREQRDDVGGFRGT